MLIVDDINDLLKVIKTTKGDIYTMVCFDMTAKIKEILGE
jgi:hypothetical protein